MMLSSINFTVIPFLLEALMSVEDVTEWNFGPEYVFQLNKTTTVFKKHFEVQNITAMVNCRPNVSSDYLLCHAHEIIVSKLTQKMYENMKGNETEDKKSFIPHAVSKKIPDKYFEIEFGRLGVRGFKARASSRRAYRYESITDTIEQLHVGTYLSIEAGDSMKNYENVTNGSHIISSFSQYEEDTTRASKCNTSWIITYTPSNQYNESGEIEIGENKTKFDFHLKLLPISYTNPINKTFLIERNRIACMQQPEYLMVFNEKLRIHNMRQYFNKIEIRDGEPKFTSYTHFEGNVSFPKTSDLYHFSEDVHLYLLHIRPAQNNNNKFYYDTTE